MAGSGLSGARDGTVTTIITGPDRFRGGELVAKAQLGIPDYPPWKRLPRMHKIAHRRAMPAGKTVLDVELSVLPELFQKLQVYSGA